jgi:hypothetical protein
LPASLRFAGCSSTSLERSVYAAGIDVVDRLARELGLEASDLLKRPDFSAKKRGSSDRGTRK